MRWMLGTLGVPQQQRIETNGWESNQQAKQAPFAALQPPLAQNQCCDGKHDRCPGRARQHRIETNRCGFKKLAERAPRVPRLLRLNQHRPIRASTAGDVEVPQQANSAPKGTNGNTMQRTMLGHVHCIAWVALLRGCMVAWVLVSRSSFSLRFFSNLCSKHVVFGATVSFLHLRFVLALLGVAVSPSRLGSDLVRW